jgi:hypothetical protein
MSATKPGAERWDGPIIPFEIDADLDNPDRIMDAIRNHWETRTNIRFVQRARQSAFVLFRHGQQCSSPEGKQGGMQPITLKPNCGVDEIIHEIGHAMGFIHEHKRSDRNNFVQVQADKIEPGQEHNFTRIGNSLNLTDYDLRSTMHYGASFFSVDGSPTLVPVDPAAVLNSSDTFTDLDVQGINKLYPHIGIVRRSDSGFDAAGQVGEIAVANGSNPSDIVTAVRTAAGTLRLILWRINRSGGITREDDSADDAGKATSISIARGNLFVTACRNGSGNLFLISWSIDGNGFIREGSSRDDAAGKADLIQILALTGDLFVTACRAANGNLKLITWRLVGGSLERLQDKEAGEVSSISFVQVRRVGTSHQVATTVRAGNDNVVVIVWNVAADGSIERLGENRDFGEGDLIQSCIHPATGLLVVSCRAANGNLKVITLSVLESGLTVHRHFDSGDQAGKIHSNALMARPRGVLSAVKADNDNLKLIAWDIDAAGHVTRLGDSAPDQVGGIGLPGLPGRFGLVQFADDTRHPEAPVLTCVQTEENKLKLITWDDQPANGELTTIGTSINLNGAWTAGGPQRALISSAFTSLTIDMSAFSRPTAHGSILDSSTITVTFPDDKTFTGKLQPPDAIRWSNGSAWRKV